MSRCGTWSGSSCRTRSTWTGTPAPAGPWPGTQGCGRAGSAPASPPQLNGRGWFAALAEQFVGTALVRLDGPASAWRDALLAGVAEVAATADHPDFAAAHLELLAELLGERRRGGR